MAETLLDFSAESSQAEAPDFSNESVSGDRPDFSDMPASGGSYLDPLPQPGTSEFEKRMLGVDLIRTREQDQIAKFFAEPKSLLRKIAPEGVFLPPEDPGSLENVLRKLPLGAGDNKELKEDRVKGIASFVRRIGGELPEELLKPENLPLIPMAFIPGIREAMAIRFGGEAIGAGAGEAAAGIESGDTSQIGGGLATAVVGTGIGAAGAKGTLAATIKSTPAAVDKLHAEILSREKSAGLIQKSELTEVEKAGLRSELEETVPAAQPITLEEIGPPKVSRPIAVEDFPDNPSSVTSFLTRNFTKERGLSEETYKLELQRRGAIQENLVSLKYNVRELSRAVGEEVGQSIPSVAISGLRKASPALIKQIDDALHGSEDVNSLPASIRQPVAKMRSHIDALSSQLQDLVGSELAAVIERNKGVYLTRSHRVFDDPKWVYDNVPLDVRNNAKRIVQEETGLSDVQAESYLRDLFADWKSGGVDGMFNPRSLGAKDVSILMKRQDLTPEFQALMGTYKDPFVNYARSIGKLSRLVADQTFLNTVYEQGIGKWLFKEGENPPGFNTQISGEGSIALSPLNGLRTSEHMAKVFKEWNKADKIENLLFKAYLALNSTSKASKTVYSALTQARNMEQFWFWTMNGHFKPSALREAIGTVLSDIGAMDSPKWQAYHTKLARLNLIGESPFGNEIRDMIGDFSKKLADQNVSPMDYGLAHSIKTLAIKAPERAYQLADEFGKIVGFEAEKARLLRDNPKMPVSAAELEAAFRVRNTYPTYTNIPVWMRKLRRIPTHGMFISFPYEVVRTTGHGLNYLREDFKAGHWQSAAERGAGMMLVFGGATVGLQLLSRHLLGLSEKDDRDLRSQLPPWEKNSALLYTDKGTNSVSYINLSYNNPYSYFSDPLISMFNDYRDERSFLKGLTSATAEFLRPWTTDQALFSALQSVDENKDPNGQPVYNEQADTWVKWETGLEYIWRKALEPGTITRLRPYVLPLKGESTPRSTPGQQAIAELTGFKQQNHDFVESLGFRAKTFVANLRDSTALFTDGLRNPRRHPDVLAQYQSQEEARFRLFTQLARDIQVARRQGATDQIVIETLRNSGVGKETIESVMNFKYKPYIPGDKLLEGANRAGHPIPAQELRRMVSERSKLVLNP